MTIKSKAFKFLLGIAVVLGVAVSASLASAADFGTATLRVGSRGAAVMEVQKVVEANPVDGIFGPMTMAAVKAWQANNGLTPDGVVGNATKAAMNAVSEVVAPSSGCQAGWIVNPFTNQPCGTTTPTTPSTPSTPSTTLKGGAGELTVVDSSKNVESSVKEGDEEKVIAFKLTAEDSDISVSNLKVFLQNDGNAADNGVTRTSEKLPSYIEEVKVYLGNKEVGSADASDFSRESKTWDEFTKSISLSGAVVSEGDSEYLYVTVVADSDIDSDDEKANWNIAVTSLRYTDGTGAIMSADTATTGALTGEVNPAIFAVDGHHENFGFKDVSTDDQIDLKSSSSNPEATSIKVDEDDTTDDVLALAFKLDVDEDSADVDIDSLEFTVTLDNYLTYTAPTWGAPEITPAAPTLAQIEKIIDSAIVEIDGEEFEADLDSVAPAAGKYGVATYSVDFDGDVTINSGDIEEVRVLLTFTSQGDGAYNDGLTVQVSVAKADISAEVDGDSLTVGGTSPRSGGVLTLSTSSANITSVTASSKTDADSTVGTFTFKFTVEADGGDVEIDDTSIVETMIFPAGETATQVFSVMKTSGTATTNAAGSDYTVEEGNTATFTLTYTIDPAVKAGQYYMTLDSVDGVNVDKTAGPESLVL